MRGLSHALMTSLVLGGLVGCGEEPPPPAPPPAAASKKKVEAAPAGVAVAQVDYVYNPINKRDPFRSFLSEESGSTRGTVAAEVVSCSEPLCLVDLDELRVVAVVSGDANPLGMVEDRSGVGHIVRRNTRMGKQGGKVTQILRDCIVVTSFLSGGPDGKALANKQNLCVKLDERKDAPPLDLFQGKGFTP